MKNSHMFASPVGLSLGLGFKREIGTLDEMHAFLDEWSPSRRGEAYVTALKACRAARSGIVTVEQAERAFRIFAESVDILWEGGSVGPVLAARAMRRPQTEHVS